MILLTCTLTLSYELINMENYMEPMYMLPLHLPTVSTSLLFVNTLLLVRISTRIRVVTIDPFKVNLCKRRLTTISLALKSFQNVQTFKYILSHNQLEAEHKTLKIKYWSPKFINGTFPSRTQFHIISLVKICFL